MSLIELKLENEKLRLDNQDLRKENSELKARIEKLERMLSKDSRNSDKPPSSDPPYKNKNRQKRKRKRRRTRPGTSRKLRAESDVDQLIKLHPKTCRCCGGFLPHSTERPPWRHQVTELPIAPARVTEHQMFTVSCPQCSAKTKASLPKGIGHSSFGPRLTATVSLLTGGYRMSKRQVQQLLKTLWGVKMSLGAISQCEARMSDALDEPFSQACRYIQSSPTVYADETPWKEHHKLSWLWTAGTKDVVTFRIQKHRSSACAKVLLGENFDGILVSDRYNGYAFIPMDSRQVCWSHLRRDFTALSEEHECIARYVGTTGVGLVDQLFHSWHQFQRSLLEHAVFRETISGVQQQVEQLLDFGANAFNQWTRSKCKNMLKYRLAFWNFVNWPGIEPTNNRSERALRHGVIYRKVSLGTQSERGSRFVERMMTAALTLRAQSKDLYLFLVHTIEASLGRRPVPSLLPATP